MQLVLTPELLLEAYRHGLFPMAYNGQSPYIHWICPEKRGQLPIDQFHIPRSLKTRIRRNLSENFFQIRINTAFEDVMRGCAAMSANRPETWINEPIIVNYTSLHERGYAHSVECWAGDELVGGVYGIALGAAFFGESMFSRMTDASKIALSHLTARLWNGGFCLFDTQFLNDHLKQFGAYEISHKKYMALLQQALLDEADFHIAGRQEAEIMLDFLDRT